MKNKVKASEREERKKETVWSMQRFGDIIARGPNPTSVTKGNRIKTWGYKAVGRSGTGFCGEVAEVMRMNQTTVESGEVAECVCNATCF